MRLRMEAVLALLAKSDTCEATKPGFLVLLPRSPQTFQLSSWEVGKGPHPILKFCCKRNSSP